MPESDGLSLVVLGLLLLGGCLAHLTSRRFPIPKVTLLLIIGALSGPSGFDIVPDNVVAWFPFVSHLALAMVGFLLGESFAGKQLKETGRVALVVSIAKAVLAAVVVLGATRLAGASWPMALLLAGIAPASAPAAIMETIHSMNAKGRLSTTVLEVVAIDDAWGVLIFSIMLTLALAVTGGQSPASSIGSGLWEVFGALLLGGGLGLVMAWLTGKIRGGEPTLVEASGFVILCAGLGEVLGVSYLLATMTLGTVLANRAADSMRPFHEIEHIRAPFLAMLFLLAGFRFEVDTLVSLGLIGGVYIVGRAGAFIVGAWAAGRAIGAAASLQRSIGWCLMPQAGVALGLALLAEREVSSVRGQVIPLVIATTIVFGVTGPLLLRWRLIHDGEAGAGDS